MKGWSKPFDDFKKELSAAAELEAPNAVDEFAAADSLEKHATVDEKQGSAMSEALENLRARHLAFKRAEKCEECDLAELRLQILTAVTERADLRWYYYEAWGITGDPSEGWVEFDPQSDWRRIAVMQVELVVRAFTTLQLLRFGNAPENHGWMALFRAWGRSPRFNQVFAQLQSTLPPQFVKFYQIYLKDLPAFASVHGNLPVHHPWLLPSDPEQRRRFRGRGCYMDSGIVEGEIEIEVRPGSGGSVDPRGPDRADQTFEKPSDSSESGGNEPAPNE